jgi:hypothetical protein
MPPQQTADRQSQNDTLPSGMSQDGGDTSPATPQQALDTAHQQQQATEDFKKKWLGMSRKQKEDYAKGLSADQVGTILDIDNAQHPTGTLEMRAAPPLWSKAGLKQLGYDAMAKVLTALPSIGGIGGAWGGGAMGAGAGTMALPGVGTVSGEATGQVVGSALGGGTGEAARQGIEHLLGWDEGEYANAGQRWKDIGLETAYNSLSELVGRGVGKALTGGTAAGKAERQAAKLAFAGGLEHGANALGPSDLSVILPDLITLEKKFPVRPKTGTADLANLIGQLRKNVGAQVDDAYLQTINQGGTQVPLGMAQANTANIANRVNSLLNDLKVNPDINAPAIREVEQVKLLAAKPRTYAQLADWRIRINDEIRSFYEMNPGVKRVAMNNNPELAAKKEVADAIRDITYPEMDLASGHPKGTTAALQKKRGIAMDLERQVLDHRNRLLSKTAIAKGESPLKRGNFSMYVTGSGRPGGAMHKVKSIISAPDVLSDADKRAASAFGRTFPSKTARALAHPVTRRFGQGAAVYALTPGTRRPTGAATPLKTYKFNFQNKDGHKIGSDDGTIWYDRETGEQVQ